MKNLFFIMVAVVLSACGEPASPPKPPSAASLDWKNSQIPQRKTSTGDKIPTDIVLSCRRVSAVARATYYYNLVADQSQTRTEASNDGTITSTYRLAEISISYSSMEDRVLNQVIFRAPVALFSRSYDGQVTYRAVASEETLQRIIDLYSSSPHFGKLALGDEVMSFIEVGRQRVNSTASPRPGISTSQILDCQ